MGKILGIDHGEKKIGLALSDDLGFLAYPCKTIFYESKEQAYAEIRYVISEHSIDKIIYGLPFKMDDSYSEGVESVRIFMARLEHEYAEQIKFIGIDERLSTVEARKMILGNKKRGKREKSMRSIRDRIDQAAAVVILQDYLDQNSDLNYFNAKHIENINRGDFGA